MNSTNSARDLTLRLQDLLRQERAAPGDFLLLLADFDRRRLWLALGFPSLFEFLRREMALSAGAAHYRKTAAHLLQRFPEVEAPLRDGRLCITSIVELAKVLTPENRSEVLPRFFHRSRRDAKVIAAEIRPAEAAPRRDVVTAVRSELPSHAPRSFQPVETVRREVAGAAMTLERAAAASPSGRETEAGPSPRAPAASRGQAVAVFRPVETDVARKPERREVVEPLTAELSRVHMTVPRSYHEKLEALRAALSHSHPGASAAELVEAAFDIALEQLAKRRALVSKPRREAPPAKAEHVPAHVRRAVWKRDGGKCQWPLDSGGICGSTHQVELDHIRPRALGGTSTKENLRCAFRIHDQLAARQVFGDAWTDRYGRGRRNRESGVAAIPTPP